MELKWKSKETSDYNQPTAEFQPASSTFVRSGWPPGEERKDGNLSPKTHTTKKTNQTPKKTKKKKKETKNQQQQNPNRKYVFMPLRSLGGSHPSSQDGWTLTRSSTIAVSLNRAAKNIKNQKRGLGTIAKKKHEFHDNRSECCYGSILIRGNAARNRTHLIGTCLFILSEKGVPRPEHARQGGAAKAMALGRRGAQGKLHRCQTGDRAGRLHHRVRKKVAMTAAAEGHATERNLRLGNRSSDPLSQIARSRGVL